MIAHIDAFDECEDRSGDEDNNDDNARQNLSRRHLQREVIFSGLPTGSPFTRSLTK